MKNIVLAIRKLNLPDAVRYWLEVGIKWVCVLIVFATYSIAIWTIAEHQAEKKASAAYQIELQNYILERDAQDAARTAMPVSLQEQINIEANKLAKVLYGVKDNSTDDLRTYCWCVFNRVDNPNFANNLDDVIDQPNQWMRYSSDNYILQKLKDIAVEELTEWHSRVRPCSDEYVYMDWSAKEIVLRTDFVATKNTRYWRYS